MTQTTDASDRVAPPATREALLSAAERLFLAEGYDRVSVRAICAAADANPAAVHYHFGTKDDLTIALLESRLAPYWADPLAAFDPTSFERGHDSIRHLVEVVVNPFVELQSEPLGQLHLQLLSRFVLTHPTARWTARWFELDAFADLLTDALPGLSASAARRRWALAFQLILLRFGTGRPLDAPEVSALTDFVTAGLAFLPGEQDTSPPQAPGFPGEHDTTHTD